MTRKHRILLAISLALIAEGCTMIQTDMWPKPVFYWSKAARNQRANQEWVRTNKPPVITPQTYVLPQASEPLNELANKIQKRDGTNFLGVYQGMIAEKYDGVIWPDTNTVRHSVMMYSDTSGEMLKWIPYQDFQEIFVLKIRKEYQ